MEMATTAIVILALLIAATNSRKEKFVLTFTDLILRHAWKIFLVQAILQRWFHQ